MLPETKDINCILLERGSGYSFHFDRELSIIEYIRLQSESNPYNIALTDEGVSISYEKLLQHVFSIAAQLRSLGLSRDDRVALLMTPDHEMILLILALIALGVCYIPIDSEYPLDRVQYVVDNSQPRILITNLMKIDSQLKQLDVPLLYAHDIDFNHCLKTLSLPKKLGDKAAYTIYTSGSTGQPKGINVPHRAVNNHMLWMQDQFDIDENDKFLLKTPITFDPSVWEIFLPFYIGAELVVAKSGTHANPGKIIEYICEYGITVIQLVPAMLYKIIFHPSITECNKSLRYYFVGGESLSTVTKKHFFKTCQCNLVNLYGPAETTIDSSFYVVQNDSQTINHNLIGRPIYNTQLFVLNSEQELCEIGEVGELYISGDNLALGYQNNPLLNDKFFIKNPYIENARMYKTGDLAKWHDSGDIEYIGRKDHQVKINGVRIETESLRTVIMSMGHVYDCYFEKQTSEEYLHSLLVCYIVPDSDVVIELSSVKQTLKKKFPHYMIPKKFYIVNNVELSHNGKISIKNIKKSNHSITKKSNMVVDDVEHKLLSIWQSILNIDSLDENVSFYDAGGDSIASYILVSEISKVFGITINPEDVINYATLKQQMNLIKVFQAANIDKLTNKTIVELNTGGQSTAFFVHPIGGTVFWYVHLARLLEGNIHVYGIQDPGIATGEVMFTSISEMAKHYTEQLLAINPDGPYILGGASFGATVVIEIARNLLAMGKTIQSVVLFDGWAIYPRKLQDLNLFKESMLRLQHDWIAKYKINYNQTFDFEKAFDIQCQRIDILFEYTMKPIPFPLHLFKAKTLLPLFESFESPSNYWDRYANNCKLYNVPGNHETMFLRPNVDVIKDALLEISQELSECCV